VAYLGQFVLSLQCGNKVWNMENIIKAKNYNHYNYYDPPLRPFRNGKPEKM
jgi:hypothetical protein